MKLTLTVLITAAADILFIFRENKVDISCESFARQTIHMTCEVLFSEEKK